jgi:CheY-like chemotaxis protein
MGVGGQALILCVDDYQDILLGWEMLLEEEGYKVVTAADWSTALQLFNAFPVDEVVLDYQMAGMTGDVIAAPMKALKPDVPILLVSGDGPLSSDKLRPVEAFLFKADAIAVFLLTVKVLLNSSFRALSTLRIGGESPDSVATH